MRILNWKAQEERERDRVCMCDKENEISKGLWGLGTRSQNGVTCPEAGSYLEMVSELQ